MLRHATFLLSLILVARCALAQAEPVEFRDDVPIDTYLAMLTQVAPAARDGAEAYMVAFNARCGRPIRAIELRRAFAEGAGNPVLMKMLRAAHLKDAAAVEQLGKQIVCPR